MEKQRTIHIKGTGKASVPPDYVTLTLKLEAQNRDYGHAVRIGAQQVEMLREAAEEAGFSSDDVKTMSFAVDTEYENEKYEEEGRTRSRRFLVGYKCRHTLRLSFDMDSERLTEIMSKIGDCLAKPEISIGFTVKDTQKVRNMVLQSAAEDARRKAEILCKASGVELGDLIRIDYSWSEIHVGHSLDVDCMFELVHHKIIKWTYFSICCILILSRKEVSVWHMQNP